MTLSVDETKSGQDDGPEQAIAWRLLLGCLLLGFLVTKILTATQIPFSPALMVDPIAGDPLGFATGDLDGDGDLDLVGVDRIGDRILWWENDAGIWTAHSIVNTGIDGPSAVEVVDLDHDGDLDVVASLARTGGVTLWSNDGGASSWSTEVVLAAGVAPAAEDLVASDLDGDGDLDLGIAHQAGISWVEQSGATWILQGVDLTFTDAAAIAAGDLDNDGDLDLAAASSTLGEFTWWANDGDGGTWTQTAIDSSAAGATALDLGDADADGDLDVIAGSNALTLYENAGEGGTFVEWNLTAIPEAIPAFLDIDGDGDLDILSTNTSLNVVVWWDKVNGGSPGAFGSHIINSGSSWQTAIGGDFDSDGDLDIVAGEALGTVGLFSNQTIHRSALFVRTDTPIGTLPVSALAKGDVTGDGALDLVVAAAGVGIRVYERTTGTWSFTLVEDSVPAHSLALADLDRDGDLDIVGCTLATGLTWWESTPGAFVRHDIAEPLIDRPWRVATADLDGDGDEDIVVQDFTPQLLWIENDLDSTGWIGASIAPLNSTGDAIEIADIDRDGDLDIATDGNSSTFGDLHWWENSSADASTWQGHQVATNSVPLAKNLVATDVNHDGTIDLVPAAPTWYQQDASGVWTETALFGGNATSLAIADFDLDGATDLVLYSHFEPLFVWLSDMSNGTGYTDIGTTSSAFHMISADADRDGDADLWVSDNTANQLDEWANLGGQFALETLDVSPDYTVGGDLASVLAITLNHRGRLGDTEVGMQTIGLGLVDGADTPLDSAAAGQLLEAIEVVLDEGNGVWDGTETLVTRITDLGAVTANGSFAVDVEGSFITSFGATGTLFVILDPQPSAVGKIGVYHVTDPATAAAGAAPFEDPSTGYDVSIPSIPLILESVESARSQLELVPTADFLFADGFESGDTLSWSSTSP